MFAPYLILIAIFGIVVFIIYLLLDLASHSNVNAFYDKWVKKTLWLWLPFFALQRLIKEVILKKK